MGAGAPYGNKNAEKWKVIKGFENYMISTHGRIYSMISSKVMKLHKDGAGYLRTDLRGNTIKTIKAHRLVASAFIFNINNKPCINHKDGNKENNHFKNLEWCTYSENISHAYKTGLKLSSEKHCNSKLTNNQVIQLRIDRSNGMKYRDISIKYGVSMATSHRIVKYKNYSTVKDNTTLPVVGGEV